MATPKKPLSSILPGNSGGDDDIFDRFDAAKAADDLAPLPRGTYTAVAVGGSLGVARTGTRVYTVEFQVTEGEHAGRRLWMDRYFTDKALEYTKRDLQKLGIDSKEKLHEPFPSGRLVCRLVVAARSLDDGRQRNEVKGFNVIGVRNPEADPFAPRDDDGPDAAGGTDFPHGANEGGEQ